MSSQIYVSTLRQLPFLREGGAGFYFFAVATFSALPFLPYDISLVYITLVAFFHMTLVASSLNYATCLFYERAGFFFRFAVAIFFAALRCTRHTSMPFLYNVSRPFYVALVTFSAIKREEEGR